MDTVKALVKRFDGISEWTGRIFSWAMVPLLLLVVLEVVTRRVFNAPTVWASETVTMLYGFYFMAEAAYTLLHKAHVTVSVFHERWSLRTKAIVDMVCYVIFYFPFVGIVLWKGILYAGTSWAMMERSNSTWGPPVFYLKTVIPVAAALLIIQGLSDFIKRLAFVAKGEEL